MNIVHDPSLVEFIGNWVTRQTTDNGELGFSGAFNALGVVDNNALIAGFCFHDWHPIHRTICITLAATTPRWGSRKIIEGILSYPFIELDCQRITVTVNATNSASLRLAKGVGFKEEARLERAAGMNCDVIVLRLFVEEWLEGKFSRINKQ